MMKRSVAVLAAFLALVGPVIGQARPPAQQTGPITIFGPGSTGDASKFSASPIGGAGPRSLEDIAASGMYDATPDILKARLKPGYNNDDAPALNTVLARERSVAIHGVQPSSTITLNLKSTLYVPLSGTHIKCLGGLQTCNFQHDLSNTGSTMVIGSSTDPTKGAGSVRLEDLWFTHPGRLGYSSGALAGKLTGGQSHIEVYGGQQSYFKIGGFGMPYFMSIMGCSSTVIDSPFIYGGVWDPDNVDAQEGIAQIRFESSPIFGHNTGGFIRNFSLIGGNVTPTRTYPVGNKMYTSTRRIGPLFGILVKSLEDGAFTQGFIGGFADSSIGIISDLPSSGFSLIANIKIANNDIDESNQNGVYMSRVNPNAILPSSVDIHDNNFNGQQIGMSGLFVDGSTSLFAVSKLREHHNTYRSFLGAAVKLTGADGGQSDHNRMAGYNFAGNDSTTGSGLEFVSGRYIGGLTRNYQTSDDVFGGGQNYDVEGNSNQWGYVDVAPANGNTYSRLRLAYEGAQSGIPALALAGGGLVLGGNVYREAAVPWTPVLTAGVGTIGNYVVQAATYTIDPATKWVTAKVQIAVTDNGTGAGNLSFTLPFTSASGATNTGSGSVLGGKQLQVQVPGTSATALVLDYNGAYPAVSGSQLNLQIRYEAAL